MKVRETEFDLEMNSVTAGVWMPLEPLVWTFYSTSEAYGAASAGTASGTGTCW
ncbi:hypothetical protein [Streptomyces sp. NPDC001404]|uniref:hypothetical protein n=1 Tax=Streptomyces sp. NPDC001404 TaxID=3364571 RepID=UPI0036A451D8